LHVENYVSRVENYLFENYLPHSRTNAADETFGIRGKGRTGSVALRRAYRRAARGCAHTGRAGAGGIARVGCRLRHGLRVPHNRGYSRSKNHRDQTRPVSSCCRRRSIVLARRSDSSRATTPGHYTTRCFFPGDLLNEVF
jgi:hypothetical protein